MMAHPRVYRHNVRCPECGSNWMPKAGTDQGRQVYRCGDCQRYYTPDAAYHRPSAADRERALAMYQEGSSLRAVGRVFGVSAQAVSRWVKKGGLPPGAGCAGKAVSVLPELPATGRRR